MQKTYALFDFDGTLRHGDSIVSLCLFARKKGLCSVKMLLNGLTAALAYGLGLRTAEQAKATAMRWIRGMTVRQMETFAQEFCHTVLLPELYPEGLASLKAEKKRGAAILFITASPACYLEPLKKALGLEDIIGTRMALEEDRYTGEICGDNCRGLQKPLRLAEYLAAKGDRLDYATSTAYGDSLSDLPMLELCAQAVAVNPKRRLLSGLANRSGVRVVAWGQKKNTSKGGKHHARHA
ncbi:MAG: HAD-IB family hydrolase [Eubacteriales bacterium]|nr:HAD-IB family hydrolase [Eubacteriales bacterium]